tara:strand:+ start:265 stop:504 length:240 start_codon:yes stop_codon:yes gene_type:complete
MRIYLEIDMTKVTINYEPAKHDGIENTDNSIFRYVVETDEPFENLSNGEKFAGFGGKCVETGEYKRFRWDRIESIVHHG